MSPTQRNLEKPQLNYHPPGVFLNLGQTLTCKASDTQASSSEPNETLALIHRAITIAYEKLAETDWVHSLPFQRFQALLTLFSKSFSSFPHGTCLLSVSNLYLALDEIYHPLCAPIPRNVTHRRSAVHRGLQITRRDSHPLRCSFPRGLYLRLHWQPLSRLQFKAQGPDFHSELIPVHSPLLRESYLVSLPPLTYMLKFSGFSHLTSCLGWKRTAIGMRQKLPTNGEAKKQIHKKCLFSCSSW